VDRTLYTAGSALAAGLTADLLGKDPATAALAARNAAENNYLTGAESRRFDKELSECKASGGDCRAVYEKYLAISNKNSQALRERCADGGVACAQYEELIRAYTRENLHDPEAAAMTRTLNGLDLLFLDDRLSTTDRLVFGFVDNFPLSLVGVGLAGRNLATNTGGALAGATLVAGTDALLQYSLTGDVSLSDLVAAGVIGAAFASPTVGAVNPQLLDELIKNGVKVTPKNVLATARSSTGQVIFLETGTPRSGLQHIIERHGVDFANKGISQADIPSVVMRAVTQGKVVGTNATAPVYEIIHNGVKQHIAVGVGSNGYIVRANPVNTWKSIK
jgi:filamentous hemagglutinin